MSRVRLEVITIRQAAALDRKLHGSRSPLAGAGLFRHPGFNIGSTGEMSSLSCLRTWTPRSHPGSISWSCIWAWHQYHLGTRAAKGRREGWRDHMARTGTNKSDSPLNSSSHMFRQYFEIFDLNFRIIFSAHWPKLIKVQHIRWNYLVACDGLSDQYFLPLHETPASRHPIGNRYPEAHS